MSQDRVIQLINAAGSIGLALVFTWGATSCFETRRRYDYEKLRLEQRVEELDELLKKLQETRKGGAQ